MSSSKVTVAGAQARGQVVWSFRWICGVAGLCGVFLVGYLLTRVSALSAMSLDYADYPFGTDVPAYAFMGGSPRYHALVTAMIHAYEWVLRFVNLHWHPLFIKLPYAVIGAAYVGASVAAFGLWLRRADLSIVLYGSACGLALMNWYYAASPESYMLSGLLYALYLCAVLYQVKNGVTDRAGSVAAAVFLLTMLNDLSALLLLLVPTMYWGVDLMRVPVLRRVVLYHLSALVVYAAIQFAILDFFEVYATLIREYSPMAGVITEEAPRYRIGTLDPVVAYFLHSLAAPTAELTNAPWLNFPDYRGFFEGSPLAYVSNLPGILFVAAYVWLLSFVRLHRIDRLGVGLLAFVFARFVMAIVFNPAEAIIYASVATLAWLLVLFSCLDRSGTSSRNWVAGSFCVALLIANARFLI